VEEITSTAQTVPTDLTTRTVKDISNPKREALSRAGHVLRPVLPNFRVSGMQKWEGRITEVNDATLTAELTPLLDEGVTVTGDIDLDLLSPEEDVQPGDVVYVTVRTVIGPSGHRTRTSSVRLRRLGRWTEEEISRVRSRARERLKSLEQYFD
jgi:hypothetical protein